MSNVVNGRFSGIETSSENATTAKPVGLDPSVKLEGMYSFAEIEGARWNQVFPYQLLVISKEGNGWKRNLNWQFTLPFAPSSIDIEMPFAITTSATLGGIIEEHNGAPFRMISMSGTFGVLPLKGTAQVLPKFDVARSIFAGTVVAVSSAANGLINSTIQSNPNSNLVEPAVFSDPTSSISRTSGYYQAKSLEIFLQSYAEYKKTSLGKSARLALAMWKDNAVYLVTPMQFRVQRAADSPLEYRYSMSFKAWSKINLDAGPTGQSLHSPVTRDPNAIANVLNKLAGVRQLLENGRKTLQAFRGDVNAALFTPLREITLMLKSLVGATKSLADLPFDIVSDSADSITEFLSDLNAVAELNISDDLKRKINQIQQFGQSSGKEKTSAGKLEFTPNKKTSASPAIELLANPENLNALTSQIDISKLKLPISIQRQINAEIDRTLAFTRENLQVRRDSVKSVMVDYAQAVGLGATTYNTIYGITPSTTSVNRVATDSDFELLFQLNQALIELNRLTVSEQMNPNTVTSSEFFAGLATRSGIAFTIPQSKFLVPFLYNHTLEQMAVIYLNDANRWHEIAQLNGLREPYVDESGFDLPLTTNGAGNSIQLSTNKNLYVGQTVYISAAGISPEKRQITGITFVSDGVYVVNLSGESDLVKYTTGAGSKIHAYLPNTVNSQMSLFIPSEEPTDENDFRFKDIPGVDYLDNFVRVGGVSLLLTQGNDIAFGPNGSLLAVGLTNIVQKARIAISTPRGTLIQHPDYGLRLNVGDNTSEVDAKDVLKSIRDMFSNDSSFSGVDSASILKNGSSVRISVNVSVRGTSKNLPITTEIKI
jgi:hypothetical protein